MQCISFLKSLFWSSTELGLLYSLHLFLIVFFYHAYFTLVE